MYISIWTINIHLYAVCIHFLHSQKDEKTKTIVKEEKRDREGKVGRDRGAEGKREREEERENREKENGRGNGESQSVIVSGSLFGFILCSKRIYFFRVGLFEIR